MFGLTPYNSRNMGLQRRMRDFFDMDSWIDSFFNDSFLPPMDVFGNPMKVDIKENKNDYVIEADLPGVDKNNINIELRDGILSINVQRNEIQQEERGNYIRKERRTSSLSRSFRVGNVKPEDVSAKFENGVLSITLPKADEEKNNQYRIDIQ
ncbi:MAG: Hsp20/alpha crystallin family protein [Clostridiales bacterium]|nr:Hsp20/alpha crystallin family protein [Clostridiales bacterium]